MYYLFQ